MQFELADLATEIEAARLLTYNAARLRDDGAALRQGGRHGEALRLAGGRARDLARSIEVYGGNGFTREYPVEKYFRDQKVGQIYEGTSNMQLLVIAKQILGKM